MNSNDKLQINGNKTINSYLTGFITSIQFQCLILLKL